MRTPIAFLTAFAAVAVGLGAARALTTAYVPVLLDEIEHNPGLIGAVMLVNAAAGFAVPLLAGLWSDRREPGRFGRRAPFILGGAAVAAGGLVAIALGTTSSYLALALAAAAVYVGLNAAQTAHRALVAERFGDGDRPKATSSQEGAMLVGALVGTVAGGALVEASAMALFAGAAVATLLLAIPTVMLRAVRSPVPALAGAGGPAAEGPEGGAAPGGAAPGGAAPGGAHPGRAAPGGAPPGGAPSAETAPAHSSPLRGILAAARVPGAREVLLAQIMWVFAYAALTPFMVLYAGDVLNIGAAKAGLLLAGFGLLTGGGMIAAGKLPKERVRPTVIAGAALLGGGLLLALPASSILAAAPGFAMAAVGAGLVTALGFPYYARFIPPGEAGTYSGVFFSARAVAATAALPAAGGLVAVTGSYRALLAQGGAALLAVVPLARAEGHPLRLPRPRVRLDLRGRAHDLPGWSALAGVGRQWWLRLSALILAAYAVGAALPALQPADERAYVEINRLGDGPQWLVHLLDPHQRNYVVLLLVAMVAAAFTRRARYVVGAGVLMLLAGFGSDLVLEPFQLIFDRDRPEEALGAGAAATIEGRTWGHIPSFPSGHLIVTAALVAAAISVAHRLKWPLLAYLAAIAITRVTFGAHFPLDVIVGGVLGFELGLFSAALVRAAGLLPAPECADCPPEPVPQPVGVTR